jgi:hypothetical protein
MKHYECKAGCGCPDCADKVVKANAIKMQRDLDAAKAYNPDAPFDSKAYARKVKGDLA